MMNKSKFTKEDNDQIFMDIVSKYLNHEQINIFQSKMNDNPLSSLILNKRKLLPNEFLKKYDFLISDNTDEYIYQFDSKYRLSKSVDNFVGSFYLMDKSSAIISYYVQKYIKMNSLVLDICSAPGGKSISFSLRRDDLVIVSNDISYKRELETIKNTERLGLINIMMMSIDPLDIKDEQIYDFIILDVPCSGSGMLRKDKDIKNDFSLEKVKRLLPIQKTLLDKSTCLLKEGGYLLYSTCSLSTEEDEEQIESFLNNNPQYEEINLNIDDKTIIRGLNNHGYHLIPGIYDGEGIYFSLLKKKGLSSISHKEIKYSHDESEYHLLKFKNNTYAIKKIYEEIYNYNYLSLGIKVNNTEEYKKCEYNHAYCKIAKQFTTIELDKNNAYKYISGQEITYQNGLENGLVVLTYNKIPLGFGKISNSRIKNYLPKGLKENLIF